MVEHYRNNRAFWNGANNKSKKQNYWCGFKTIVMEHSQPVPSIWVCRVEFEQEDVVDRNLVDAFSSFGLEQKNSGDDDDDEPEPACQIELKHGGSVFIHYKTAKQAENAVEAMHGYQVHENARKLIVDYALDTRKSLLPPSVVVQNGQVTVVSAIPEESKDGKKKIDSVSAAVAVAAPAPAVAVSAFAAAPAPAATVAVVAAPAPAPAAAVVSTDALPAAAPAVVIPAAATTKTLAALSSAAAALASVSASPEKTEQKMLTAQSSIADVVAWIKTQKFPIKTEKTLVEKFQAHHINGGALLEAESVDELLTLMSVALLAGPLLNLRRAWKVQKQAASEH